MNTETQMEKMKTPILIVLGIVIGVVCCFMLILFFGVLKPLDEIYKEEPINKTLVLSNDKKVYVRALFRGITGDYEEIVFSETPITVVDKKKDYVFYTNEVFYKIDEENNVLTIYAPSSKNIPEKLFENITLVFKPLKTNVQIKDFSINYEKYGLERVSTL